MAILIPNMKMPETCSDCSFQYDCIQCNITGTNFWDKAKEVCFDFTRERLLDCPLIEIADNLEEYLMAIYRKRGKSNDL